MSEEPREPPPPVEADLYAAPATDATGGSAVPEERRRCLHRICQASVIVSVPLVCLLLAQLFAVIALSLTWRHMSARTGRPGMILLIAVLSLAAAVAIGFLTNAVIRLHAAARRHLADARPSSLAMVFERNGRVWRLCAILLLLLFIFLVIAGF